RKKINWLTRNDDNAEDMVQESYSRAIIFFPTRAAHPRCYLTVPDTPPAYLFDRATSEYVLHSPNHSIRPLALEIPAIPRTSARILLRRSLLWAALNRCVRSQIQRAACRALGEFLQRPHGDQA